MFFYYDGFGIEYSTKVYMPLKKEIKKQNLLQFQG